MRIQCEGDSPGRHHRFKFGGEKHDTVFTVEVQRLLPHPITCQHQTSLAAIPKRKREHATQVFHTIESILFIEVHDHFAITAGFEPMSL